MNPKLEVRESPLGGRGVFTLEEFAAGELLAVFGGRIMKASDEIDDWAVKLSEELVMGNPPGGMLRAILLICINIRNEINPEELVNVLNKNAQRSPLSHQPSIACRHMQISNQTMLK